MARQLIHPLRSNTGISSPISTVSCSEGEDGHQSVLLREEEKFIEQPNCGDDSQISADEHMKLIDLCNRFLQFYDPDRSCPAHEFIAQYYKEDNCKVNQITYIRFLNDVWTGIISQSLLKMPIPKLDSSETANFRKIQDDLTEIMERAKEKAAIEYKITLSIDILMDIAIQLLSNQSFIKSAVCHFAVASILSCNNKNNSSGISTCVYHIFQISKDLKKHLLPETFQCLMEHIFPLVWEIISHFGSIQLSISHESEVDFEHGVSLYYLARMYNICGQYEEDAAINERAIKKLRHSRVSSWFYACCHNNAGVAHMKLKNYEKAKVFYKRAIYSYKLVTHSTCAKKRDDSIATTKKNLRRVEDILKSYQHGLLQQEKPPNEHLNVHG